MSFAVVFMPLAARQIQRERVWLCDHRGHERAEDFEAELAHALDLLQECPEMGSPSPRHPADRQWFLRRSRFHVYYRVSREQETVLILRIRHQAQRPPDR